MENGKDYNGDVPEDANERKKNSVLSFLSVPILFVVYFERYIAIVSLLLR